MFCAAQFGSCYLAARRLLVGHLFNKKEPQQEGETHPFEDTLRRLLGKLALFHTMARSSPEASLTLSCAAMYITTKQFFACLPFLPGAFSRSSMHLGVQCNKCHLFEEPGARSTCGQCCFPFRYADGSESKTTTF